MIGAVALPLIIGILALVAEFGHGLLIKNENQRVADLAAYAGALAYNPNSSTANMTAAAQNVAILNGIAAANLSVSLTTSPRSASSQAVLASISTSSPLLLAPVLGSGRTLSVSSSAYAALNPQTPACVLALSSTGTGVTLSGGTALSAPSCAVSSDNTVSVPCGTTITTKAVSYNSAAAPSQPCNGITSGTSTAVKITKSTTPDPLAGNSGVATATARISTVASLTSPSAPSVTSGTDLTFDYGSSATSQATTIGCTAAFSSSTWTVTCPSGSYRIGNITIAGGLTVNFNTSGSASTTYNFSGSINNSGSALNFGPGTYNIAQGITTGGGTRTSFGAGTFSIGAGTSACNGGGRYSLCNLGTSLTFGGPSTFVLSAGIYNTGGSSLTLGSGTTNTFQIGSSSDGNAIYLGGGSTTVLADALVGSSSFQLVGNLNVASGGGSCLTLSAAAQHDINGYVSTAGGTVLGAGVYTVNGYIAFGANGGGDVTCGGSSVGVRGIGVTLVISGLTTPSSGTCAGMSFCVAAGYSNVTLTAPTSGTATNMVVIGPASRTGGATFAEGASNTSLSGAFYFPDGPITLSGGASVGNGTGQCLELIGTQVTLTGGTAAASTCVSGSASASAVSLVQ